MKEKVEEVVNYFKTKIKTLDCVINEVTHRDNGWTTIEMTIDDEYLFRFSISEDELLVIHDGIVRFEFSKKEVAQILWFAS